MKSRLPDFLIIGAMKSGTTTLHEHLDQHPGVFMSRPKEPNFFSIDTQYERGTDWYASLFEKAHEYQVCGEASPSYSRFPRFAPTTERVAQLLPKAKLVYIMRHPVDRFYSNYVFDRAYGFNDSISETLKNRTYVLETSNYMLQIERYLQHYPREQILLLLLDDLEKKPQDVMRQLFDFLGVEDHEAAPTESVQANPRGRNYMARQCNTSLQRIRSAPGMRLFKQALPAELRGKLRNCVTQKLPDSRLGKWLANRHTMKTEPLTPELRREILSRLAEPTAQLEKFLGRDLAAWRS